MTRMNRQVSMAATAVVMPHHDGMADIMRREQGSVDGMHS